MGLLIKDKNADFSGVEGAEKYYYDALTTNGTVLLLDFSRKSTLPNNNLVNGSRINDLAIGGTSLNNNTNFKVTSSGNADDDFLVDGTFLLRNVDGGEKDGGINLGRSIQNYLRTNDVKKALFIIWMYCPNTDSPFNASYPSIQSTTGESIGNQNLIRVYYPVSGAVSISIAGVATQGFQYKNDTEQFRQVAVVYERGQVLKTYRSAAKVNSDSLDVNNNSWGVPDSDLVIGNQTNDGINSTIRIGRILIEDLDKSGRNPVSVIQQDYDYVNAVGEYEGIEKRPYANL